MIAMVRTRYAFVSRVGSTTYVAVTYDDSGKNLPTSIDSNPVNWTRIGVAEGEMFLLFSTADMERDLHEVGVHITETRTKPRHSWNPSGVRRSAQRPEKTD